MLTAVSGIPALSAQRKKMPRLLMAPSPPVSANFTNWTCEITRLVISQARQFLRLKPYETAFLAELIRKLEVSEQFYYII